MTYAGKEDSWIDGVIQASHPAECGTAGALPPQSPLGSTAFHDPRHAALLSRLLATAPDSTAPCVLFIACDGAGSAGAIAMGTAQAAAGLLGRSLLVDAWLGRRRGTAHAVPDQPHGAPIPDAFMPRLYHRQLSQQSADIALLFGRARTEALASLAAPFRFVAIDAPPPNAGPAANALASLCIGTVLVVTAGRCGRDAIRNSAGQIVAAGGRIIGNVLVDAPADLPRWVGA